MPDKKTLAPYGGYAVCSHPNCRAKASWSYPSANGSKRLICDRHAKGRNDVLFPPSHHAANSCSWPVNKPKDPNSSDRMDRGRTVPCNKPTIPGKQHCEKHHALSQQHLQSAQAKQRNILMQDHKKGTHTDGDFIGRCPLCDSKKSYVVVTYSSIAEAEDLINKRASMVKSSWTGDYTKAVCIVAAETADEAADISRDFEAEGEEGLVETEVYKAVDIFDVLTGRKAKLEER